MSERFETGLSSNYLPNWGAVEGIKEFVQNAVYAKAILGDTISIEHDGDSTATIRNYPSGFEKGKLLIGESNQRGVAGSPGEYGEGSKVGMSVLLREGREVVMTTNGFTVVPELENSSLDPEVRVLAFYIEDHDVNEGTTVTIKCSQEELEQAKSSFAILNGITQEEVSQDSILDTGCPSKSIYVNGVKVYTSECSLNDYNFTDGGLMNRDRTTVDMDKVRRSIRTCLAHNVSTVDQAKSTISFIMNNTQSLEAISGISYYDMSASNAEVWKKAIHQLYGDKVAMATGGESDTQARYKRFTLLKSVPYGWTHLFECLGVKYSNEIRGLNSTKNIHRKPTGERSANLAWCKRLVKLYVGDYGTVKVSEELYDDHNNMCDGIYNRETDTIWIRADILDSKEETFKTLVHEAVHRITGASDNTEEFTRGFEQACWGILMRGKI